MKSPGTLGPASLPLPAIAPIAFRQTEGQPPSLSSYDIAASPRTKQIAFFSTHCQQITSSGAAGISTARGSFIAGAGEVCL